MSWQEIREDRDIENLFSSFGNFHDSIIREVHLWAKRYVDVDLSMSFPPDISDQSASLLFQRQASGMMAVQLHFDGLSGFNLVPNSSNQDGILMGAKMLILDSVVYWAADRDWLPSRSDKNYCTWVAGKKAFWQAREDYIGPGYWLEQKSA